VNWPVRLAELTPEAARRALLQAPRIIVPVGTLVPRGPHLPLGCDTMLLERLAHDLSARTGIPCAPTIPFGVTAWSDESSPGSAGLTRKTLHRMMNELIAAWETGAKVGEITILTAHPTDSHLEALSTIRSAAAVRLIDVFGIDFRDLLADPTSPLHGGEFDTSLMLAIAPAHVATDRMPPGLRATADTGLRLYERMLSRLAHEIRSALAASR
jgi:creatinine amidohydrolase